MTEQKNEQLQTTTPKLGHNSIMKADAQDVWQMAAWAFESQMFPQVKSKAQAAMVILGGRELGFEPITSLMHIHFFQGRIVPGAELLSSKINQSGRYKYEVLHLDNQRCAVQFHELKPTSGRWEKLGVPVEYTYQEATKAGLTSKDVWQKYPADMLFKTCIRKGFRRYTPDLLSGPGIAALAPESLSEQVSAEVETASDFAASQMTVDAQAEIAAEKTDDEPDAIDAEIVEPEPETPNSVESRSRDDDDLDFVTAVELDERRQEARYLLDKKTLGNATQAMKILRGRIIGDLSPDALNALIEELKGM